MAVTFAVSTPSTTNAATYASGSFTPAVGDLLVVFVVATGTTLAGTCTESLGETTFTNITTATKANSADTLYLFISDQPLTTASARTVTYGTGGANASGAVVTVYRISGQSRFGANAARQTQTQSNTAGGSNPQPIFDIPCLATNPTLGMVANATNPASLTPPINWTEDSDNGYTTPNTGQASISRDSGFTGVGIGWGSNSASQYGDIIVEIDASAISSLLAQQDDYLPPIGGGWDSTVTVW